MLLANACLSVRISRTGNPKWFASQKASMAYIDVGIFYNKFLVEFSYAVEHNSPLFFSLLFVKVTLITDVIHVDISASSLGDTIVVFRDPYLFSDDIVSVFHRTTKQWLCKKNVELYFVLFTVKVWYKYKSTRSGWPNIANVFRLMNCNKCSEIYNSSVSTLYNLRGHKSFCVVYTEVIVKYQSTLILNICFISNLNSKHFKFNL